MPDKLVVLDNIERRLSEIQNIDEAKAIRDQAEALRIYAKSAKKGLAVQNRAAMIKILAEQRAGELLARVEREPGGRGKTGSTLERVYEEVGGKTTAHRWQTLATVPAEEVRRREAECTAESKELTSSDLYIFATRERGEKERSRNLHKKIDTVEGLHVGDFRIESPRVIPAESVHLVLTDPPYDEDSIDLYGTAAREAARILRPGGSLLAYSGQKYLHFAIAAMSEHMRYWWTLCIIHTGSSNLMQKLGIRAGWKPVIWMVKGTRGDVSSILPDVLIGGGEEKDAHKWQQAQAESEYLIEAFTRKGETVVDFFAGSCTTAKAAEKTGRKWIGFEIEGDV